MQTCTKHNKDNLKAEKPDNYLISHLQQQPIKKEQSNEQRIYVQYICMCTYAVYV